MEQAAMTQMNDMIRMLLQVSVVTLLGMATWFIKKMSDRVDNVTEKFNSIATDVAAMREIVSHGEDRIERLERGHDHHTEKLDEHSIRITRLEAHRI